MKKRIENNRAGFTLVEILVALAILVLVLAAVSQIMATGTQASINADLTSQAIMRCETVMAEILAGVHDKQSSNGNQFMDGSEDWYWSLVITDSPVADLQALRVTAYHQRKNQIDAQWTLTRWVRSEDLLQNALNDTSETVTTTSESL